MIVVFSNCTPRTYVRSFSTFVGQGYDVTIVIAIIFIQIAIQVHIAEFYIFIKCIVSRRSPNGIINIVNLPNIIEVIVTSSKTQFADIAAYFCVPSIISIHGTMTISYNLAIINYIFSSTLCLISIAIANSQLNIFAIGHLHAVEAVIIYIAFSNFQVITATLEFNSAQFTIDISALEFSIFIAVVIGKILLVFNHTGVGPVVVDLAVNPDTGTQFVFPFVFIAIMHIMISIVITNFTGDFYVVRFFLQVSYANAESIQFVSEFSSQFVNVSAFSHSFCYDLSHFITGHQFVAAESAVRIAVNYASSSQFAYCVICPVASRYVGERISSVSGSGYAQSHCHCKYERFFHFVFLLFDKEILIYYKIPF